MYLMQNFHFFRVEPKLNYIMCKKDERKRQEGSFKHPSFRDCLKKVSDPRQYKFVTKLCLCQLLV